MNRIALALITFLLFSAFCFSQVINIESKRFHNDSSRWVGKIDGNFSAVKNIQEVITFGLNIHTQYQKGKSRVLAIGDLAFIKAGNTDFMNSGYQHLRYNYKLNKWLTWEAFVQAQYNRVLLLDRRYLAGTGPRFKLVKREHLRIYTATLYMYEYQAQNNDSLERYTNRLSAYLSFNISFGKFEFTSTTFYQPNFADFNDYRIANNSMLELILTKHLNLKSELVLLYDTRQPLRVPDLVYTIRSGISYKF